MLQRLLSPAGAATLALAACLALVAPAAAGWDFQHTPTWSSGHGGYSPAYYSGGGGVYSESSGYSGQPSYSYQTPAVSYAPSYAAPAYASVPPSTSGMVSVQQGNTADRAAHIDIRVPAGAKIWFGKKETVQSGESRSFVSPPLDPGSDYTYDIRATWKEGGRTVERKRHVTVHAGDKLNLNLASPSRATTPVTSNSEGE